MDAGFDMKAATLTQPHLKPRCEAGLFLLRLPIHRIFASRRERVRLKKPVTAASELFSDQSGYLTGTSLRERVIGDDLRPCPDPGYDFRLLDTALWNDVLEGKLFCLSIISDELVNQCHRHGPAVRPGMVGPLCPRCRDRTRQGVARADHKSQQFHADSPIRKICHQGLASVAEYRRETTSCPEPFAPSGSRAERYLLADGRPLQGFRIPGDVPRDRTSEITTSCKGL